MGHVFLLAITGTINLAPSLPFNLLAPGRFEPYFWQVIFKLIWLINGCGFSCEIAHRSVHLTDDKSTLVYVMAWCRQATSHYLSQCWPRSLTPCGVTRPQWVKSLQLIWRSGTGPDNGLLPVLCQVITWTNSDLCAIGPVGRNVSQILIRIEISSLI